MLRYIAVLSVIILSGCVSGTIEEAEIADTELDINEEDIDEDIVEEDSLDLETTLVDSSEDPDTDTEDSDTNVDTDTEDADTNVDSSEDPDTDLEDADTNIDTDLEDADIHECSHECAITAADRCDGLEVERCVTDDLGCRSWEVITTCTQLCTEGACCEPMNAETACLADAMCGAASDGCGGSVSCGTCEEGEYCNRANQCFVAEQVWNISEPNRCYEQDLGQIYHDPGFDRWLLFYGAVTDHNEIESCASPGYSEDIWVTWSSTDGIEFGQTMSVEPPITLLTSQDLMDVFGQGDGGENEQTGWLIGDPTVVLGPTTHTWYMFFDTQSCAEADEGTWSPITVATSNSWSSGWMIQERIIDLPGHGPFSFPRIFKDPVTQRMYLFYSDTWVQVRVAELIDDGTGTNLVPLRDGEPIVPGGLIDTLSVFWAYGSYWAVADNFGEGMPDDLDTLWILGPSDTPYDFDWENRQVLLEGGNWYDYRMWAPSCIGPEKTEDDTIRCYFWANGGDGEPCQEGGSVQAGVIVY